MSRAAYDARYYAEHRDEIRTRKRAYYAENREACKAGARARTKENQRKYKEWLHILASTHTCDICGGPPTLWHHVDPSTKRANVSRMCDYSLDRIEEELELCVPMCVSCHNRFHNQTKAVA